MIRPMRTLRLAAASLTALALAACADRNPAAPSPGQAPSPAQPYGALRCAVDVRAGTLACRAAQPDGAPGVRGAVLGGQGLNVRLASSGTSYDAGTEILRSEVTVENLTSQMLGSTDGYLPDPAGVRVFFAAGPDVTAGSGSVAVENADGIDAFTASGQPFFRYAGILAPGDTTAPKEWRFSMQPTVLSFAFTVYVAAPVPVEGGWVSLTPLAPSMVEGGTLRLSAVVRSVTGRAVPGAKVTWSVDSNDTTATIDSTGLLKVNHYGFAFVTATSGGRTGSVSVSVYPGDGTTIPTVSALQVSPTLVEDNGVDSVTVRVAASDPAGINSVSLDLVPPGGGQVQPKSCSTSTPESGTTTNGVYACKFGFAPGTPGGVWRVMYVNVSGRLNLRSVNPWDLAGAGVPASVYVRGPLSDYVPPTISAFSFSPDSVRTVFDTLTIDVHAADADTGIASVTTTFVGPGGVPQVGCVVTQPVSGTIRDGVFRCKMRMPGFVSSDFMDVQSVLVRDRNNNVYEITDLAYYGYPQRVKVQPDSVNPTITAFTFSPATVVGNGVDSVSLSMTATDAWSGVRQLEARFQRVGDSFVRNCIVGFQFGAPSRTMTCKLRFNASEAGNWKLLYLQAFDASGRLAAMNAAQAQAAGWPVDLVVTSP